AVRGSPGRAPHLPSPGVCAVSCRARIATTADDTPADVSARYTGMRHRLDVSGRLPAARVRPLRHPDHGRVVVWRCGPGRLPIPALRPAGRPAGPHRP